MAFHGVRARGSSPEWHVLGRETFVADVIWDDGWPRVVESLQPVVGSGDRRQFAGPVEELADPVEELAGPELGLSWVAPGRFPTERLAREPGGWRLTAVRSDVEDDVAFAGRRQEHLYVRVTAVVAAGDGVGGLSARIDGHHRLDLEVDGGTVRAIARVSRLCQVLGEIATPAGADVVLEIRAVPSEGHFSSTDTGPDHLVVGVVGGDGFTELGRLDGRYLSTEVAGGMTGRMLGIWCARGDLLVRSFCYAGADDPDGVLGALETLA